MYNTSISLYGLETMAMTEKQQEKLQVCDNNWLRRIAGVTRIDKRRMEELREEVGVRESLTRKLVGERSSRGRWWERDPHEEVGVRESLTRKLVRSRLKWGGHVERMEGVLMSKKANVLKVEGRRRRGRPGLRWEDCLTRDLVGIGGKWRKRARDRGEWRRSGEKVHCVRAMHINV